MSSPDCGLCRHALSETEDVSVADYAAYQHFLEAKRYTNAAILLNGSFRSNNTRTPKPAVEEMLRFDGPVQMSTDRFAAEDMEFRGANIQRGDIVLAVLGSANRDENALPTADTLDIERENNRHLAFGKGIHHCLGAALARLEGEIAFSTLLARAPNLMLDATLDYLDWRPGLLIRGLQRLPVAFG